MAGLNVFVSVCWVALVAAQIKFPNDKDPSQATSNPDAPQQDAPPANPGQTRFAGLGSLDLDPLGLFSDQCDRCATNQQLAFRCCQSKNRCCSIFRPVAPVGPPFQTFTGHIPGQVGGHFPGQVGGHFPGQVGGHFPGQVGGHFPGQVGGHFPGQVGPPGHLGGVGGGKGGQCPVVAGVHTGLHRFSSGACVAECKNDFFCPGIQKCCSVGCSTVCRTPHGVPTSPVVVQPTYKPGRCPHKGFLGLLGLRSASNVPQADPGVDPDTLAHQEEQQTNKERRLTRKERREERRQFRDRREASEGPWSPRVRRSAHHKVDRNDNRERRLKRLFRKNGRVIRSAELLSRVTRQAGSDPNQRFFLGNLFCKSDCFSDFDCPGNLKCCSESKDCLKCINPAF